jgi:phage terminase large subunit GpA-like protein
MNEAVITALLEALKVLSPKPQIKISQWADAYRALSNESSAEPGKWHTERAPYQREIMDSWSDPRIKELVIMSSAQVGKTEIINNIIGYHIHLDQAPILLLQPTLEMAESWSKDRFSTMLRDTKVLSNLVKDPRSRDSGNTLLHKLFPGGHISIVGANSPASLASRPIRIVLCDEVDRYPSSAGTEGDPVSLAKKRSITFRNRKLLLTSTPTTKGASRIESAYLQSDQRHYHLPCPHCSQYQQLKWTQVKWESELDIDKKTVHKPETAHYICEHNNCIIKDSDRAQMLKRGKWIADKPFKGIAGFHLNELYSPWVTFTQIVTDFLQAKLLPETLKTWVNTALGEPWEEDGETVEADVLFQRREDWGQAAPLDVVLVTAGVDVQGDRLEVELKGWGVGEECWSLDYQIFYGSPAENHVWEVLDRYLSRPVRSATGISLNIVSTCIDSGGHHTQAVYEFCSTRADRGIFAIKGMAQRGKPIVGRASRGNRFRLSLYPIGTDTAKEVIYSRLRLTQPGPGYCHFPMQRDIEYFRQLTAEKQVTKFGKGSAIREWIKTRTKNEALDCTVYALAALKLLNADLDSLVCEMDAVVKNVTKPSAEENTTEGTYVKWPDSRGQQKQWIPPMYDYLSRSKLSDYEFSSRPDNWNPRRSRQNYNFSSSSDSLRFQSREETWISNAMKKLLD